MRRHAACSAGGMRVVAAVPALGLLAGCGLGVFVVDCPGPWQNGALAMAAVAATAASLARRPRCFLLSIIVAFTAGGVLLTTVAWQRAWRSSLRLAFESIARDQRAAAAALGQRVAIDDTASVIVDGRLTADATPAASGGASLSLQVEWIGRAGGGRLADAAVNPVDGRVLLSVSGELARERVKGWRAGRRVRAPALLRRPSRYLDPGVPDEERVMARRGIALVGSVKSGALVDVLARGSPVEELAAAIRIRARAAFADTVGRSSLRSAAIVSAIVIGDRSGLESAVQTRLQEAGTYHVIAISGGNIAILAGVTLTIFRLLGQLGRGAMLTTVVWLLAYGYLVGGSASVNRATLMAVIYLLGRTLDLGGSPLNVLALVAGLLAVRDPLIVSDPGFLLTFGATGAILLAALHLPTERLPRPAAPIVRLFVASLATELALLPVGAAFFSRITLAGLVLNFAAIPLMAIAQLAGMLAVPLYELWWPLARGTGWVAHLGAEGLVRTAELVRFAPAVTWRVAPPSLVVTALYYAAGIAGWRLWRAGRDWRIPITVAALCGMAILLPINRWRAAYGDGRLHVTFLDVGQGDAALVRFPRGATMQVDAGGLPAGSVFDLGERVVAPVLRDAGVGRLETLVVTHGDADHAGGAAALTREFRPWEVWEGVSVPRFAPLQQLAAEARNESSRWVSVQPGDRMEIDGVSVLVHHPPRPDWERQQVRNDDSIVIELRWHDVSVVLTGDIGHEVEAAIAPGFETSPLRVIKVPHHGSATSSSEAFVRRLAPAVAVVSVGRSNNYGHPAAAVLARYAAVNAAVFRTDLDGAVAIETDGSSLDVHSFTGRRLRLPTAPRKHENTRDHRASEPIPSL